jgi:hypothetical protein
VRCSQDAMETRFWDPEERAAAVEFVLPVLLLMLWLSRQLLYLSAR